MGRGQNIQADERGATARAQAPPAPQAPARRPQLPELDRPATLEDLDLQLEQLREQFKLSTFEDWPGLTLLTPRPGQLLRWAEWRSETLPLRSAVVRSETPHEIVSLGLPKFGNWDEDPHATNTISQGLTEGDQIFASEKMDGSLVIRSVVDGRVMIRTRGSLGGDFAELAQDMSRRLAPKLWDPQWRPDQSVMLEMVTPRARVIVEYAEEALVPLAVSDHSQAWVLGREECEAAARELGLQPAPAVELPSGEGAGERLFSEIKSWKGREGVVLHHQRSGEILRLKSEEYLRLHLLRFNLTPRSIRELLAAEGITSVEEFTRYIEAQNADWELVSEARPIVEALCDARESARSRFWELTAEVDAARPWAERDRKRFALEVAQKLPGREKAAAFSLLSGQPEEAMEILEREKLDLAIKPFEAPGSGRVDVKIRPEA